MKTYLVTGGAGFIGANFIHYMLNKYDSIKIINVDKLTYAGNPENVKEFDSHANYHFIQADICDKSLEDVFNQYDIDYVVNFAAESHVDRSIEDPEVFVKTNVLGTLNLLNLAKKSWSFGEDLYKEGKKFLHVSTDEVYGSLGETGFFEESTPIDPHSPYSSSKASSDLMVKAYFDTYKMPVNITRCSNNYGPYQFPEKLIPLIITNCLNGRELPLYGDGLNIRDWLYVEDHCKAVDMVINSGKPGEVYNIGGHNERTNIDIMKTIIGYLQTRVDANISEQMITYVTDRKGHDRRYGINPEKIKQELGWEPDTKFDDGIVKTIEWYLNNKDWIKNIQDGSYQTQAYVNAQK
ncbi:dTDP-glucose 4,6-dehydratase [Fictibacillus terranigra]|uniref:dTDP-glucose 4,6-dehydratase n=1 Tax=Fictibacillus terranigra TaxID=3058424 RepID=A0ABT8E206_9BACL|nr:dTDP-glucose 4,6-dehydratase [Fictibacillus sp. CENA-BCM004]MDN4071941.1 dTDP-glucose 4,6-dehydratase [Fictibacillus sp. CENA-BCM004]